MSSSRYLGNLLSSVPCGNSERQNESHLPVSLPKGRGRWIIHTPALSRHCLVAALWRMLIPAPWAGQASSSGQRSSSDRGVATAGQ